MHGDMVNTYDFGDNAKLPFAFASTLLTLRGKAEAKAIKMKRDAETGVSGMPYAIVLTVTDTGLVYDIEAQPCFRCGDQADDLHGKDTLVVCPMTEGKFINDEQVLHTCKKHCIKVVRNVHVMDVIGTTDINSYTMYKQYKYVRRATNRWGNPT